MLARVPAGVSARPCIHRPRHETGRSSARLVTLGALSLTAALVLADERTEARGHFKKGMAAIVERPLRGRNRGAASGLTRSFLTRTSSTTLRARTPIPATSTNAVLYYHQYLEPTRSDRDEVGADRARASKRESASQQATLLERSRSRPPRATRRAAGGPHGPAG